MDEEIQKRIDVLFAKFNERCCVMENQIQFVCNKFREVVSKHEQISSEHEKIKGHIFDVKHLIIQYKEENEKFNKKLDSIENTTLLKFESSENKHKEHKTTTTSLNMLQDELAKDISDLKSNDASVSESIYKIRNCLSEFTSKKDFDYHVNNFLDRMGLLNRSCEDNMKHSNFLSEKLDRVNEKIAKIEDISKEMNSDLIAVCKDCNALSFVVRGEKESNSTNLENTKNELSKKIDVKISAIPQPVIPSVEGLKDSMTKQLEPVMYDAKNAHMRSQNNESKITLLEKKLESVQLMVNQLQLKG